MPGRLYNNCFETALESGTLAMMNALIERGAEVGDYAFKDTVAMHKEHPSLLETLIKRGVNVDAYDDSFESALYTAVSRGQEEAAWLLIRAGAYVDPIHSVGTPLQAAIKLGKTDLAKELIRRGATVHSRGMTESPFREAISSACTNGGNLELADLLLDHGVQISEHKSS